MANDARITALLDCYGELLPQKQRFLIECYYNQDLSLSEIAENEGVTRQSVSDSIKRMENQLFKFEEKLKLLETSSKLRAAVDRVRATDFRDAEKINQLCDLLDKLLLN
ncbi:MAG: sigma factor-like helix-turn-helix DNA-binding protein [bacterium]|nr:sigma factor-like helix-turn-helix DNA-binding protein [bacterium]